MKVKLEHRRCGHVVAEYIGDAPLDQSIILSKDWIVLGERPSPGSLARYTCPFCDEMFMISSSFLTPADPQSSQQTHGSRSSTA